jgi:type III restriction enzyme
LENSAEVLAYTKLDRRHGLTIPYRDKTGIQREYEVDFLVKTADRIYLLETKADKDLQDPTVALKAQAAVAWCAVASTVVVPDEFDQPSEWEYLLLSENTWKQSSGIAFEALLPSCRATRDGTLAVAGGKLFA